MRSKNRNYKKIIEMLSTEVEDIGKLSCDVLEEKKNVDCVDNMYTINQKAHNISSTLKRYYTN